MMATNHALTGALIGLSVGNPIVALPLAFASHFVLDAVPHFGKDMDVRGWQYRALLAADAACCVSIVVALALLSPPHWATASLSAFVATTPDMFWAPDFFRAQASGKLPPVSGWFKKFHDRIQWYQKPRGAWIELAALALLLGAFVQPAR